MRPLSLVFCGINSFSERAEVDFSRLLEFGLFGIFGDTGSGKSTVLDCIGFALYGNVARSRSGSIADIINYKSEKAYVHFEFEITFEGRRRRFLVERELRRKNAAQSVKVYERKEGELLALTEGVRESNACLERIIGLEQKDFEKCIALPQGEFAQFVRSARGDRLKLISRLFDLERFGEQLMRRTGRRYTEAREQESVLRARMEQFEGVTEGAVKALAEEVTSRRAADEALKAQLTGAREEEKRQSGFWEKKREWTKLTAQRETLEGEKEEIAALEKGLSALEKAQSVLVASEDHSAARQTKLRAEEEAAETALRLAGAKEALTRSLAWKEEDTDEELNRLAALRERAEARRADEKRLEELTVKLNAARAEYVRETKQFSDFDYEGERAALERKLAALGEGDYSAFLEEKAKDALMRGGYAVFCGEIETLASRHPQIVPDAEPLLKKYKTLSEGGGDLSGYRAQFDAREREKKQANGALVDLEKRNAHYKMHCQRLQQLQTEGVRYREEIDSLAEKLTEKLPAPEEVASKFEALRREKREKSEARERARAALTQAESASSAAAARLEGAQQAAQQSAARLKRALDSGGFALEEEAVSVVRKFGNAEGARERVRLHRERAAAVAARLDELKEESFADVNEESVSACRARVSALEQAARESAQTLAVAVERLREDEQKLLKKRELEGEYRKACARLQLYERLKKLFDSNKFMEFVAEEYLQTVALNAGGRLLSLTDGRYFLRYEKGFLVGDNFDGGALRAVYTLSGGETFLVSLSLALALSEEICARSLRPIEFFFLDEGFGTLDGRLIDTVMDSLEKLKSEHFSIGIISHVEELKHRIERKLSVTKATEERGSQIRME